MSEKIEYGRPPFSAQPHPWLVICHGNDKRNQTFYNISEDRHEVKSIFELRNKTILAYAHEWLVLIDDSSEDCYIWNPISMDKIQLPPLPETEYNWKCLLSAPPHDPESRVFLLEDNYEKPQTLYVLKLDSDQEFHKQDLQLIGNGKFEHWTVFKGKIYRLTYHQSSGGFILFHLDLDHDSGKITVTQLCNQPAYDFREFLETPFFGSYFIQSDNDGLLYVHMLRFGHLGKDVYGFVVCRFDFVKKVWVKIKSIGETAIFLSDFWGTTCSTRGTNLKRESIYFTLPVDRRLYVFNLETESISVSLPCPHVSRINSEFYWLKLPHQCT